MLLRFVLLTDDNAVSLVSSCSANTAKLDLVFSANDDYNNRVRIDYVCIGNNNETVRGNL